MFTWAMKSQNSAQCDRGSVNVLLTYRDELGERDHLFAISDGVEKQVLHAGHQPASIKTKNTHAIGFDV